MRPGKSSRREASGGEAQFRAASKLKPIFHPCLTVPPAPGPNISTQSVSFGGRHDVGKDPACRVVGWRIEIRQASVGEVAGWALALSGASTAMKAPVRFGIVGLRRGAGIARALRTLDGATITALYDTDVSAASRTGLGELGRGAV